MTNRTMRLGNAFVGLTVLTLAIYATTAWAIGLATTDHIPKTDNSVDLGDAARGWRDIFVAGALKPATSASGVVTVTGAITASGVGTFDDVTVVDDLTVGDDATVTGALAVTGNTTLGGGTVISASYRASATIDVASIASQTCTDSALTVTGAAAGDECSVGLPAAIEAGLGGSCYVSATNTVQVRLCNVTVGAVDPASATFSARTWAP